MLPRVEGTYASDPRGPSAPTLAPRSFAPDPTRRVATVPLHGSIEPTRSSAILSDHPTRRLSPPSASTVLIPAHRTPSIPRQHASRPVSEGPGVLPGELLRPAPRYFFVTDDDRPTRPELDWSDAKERRAALDRVRAHKPVIRNASSRTPSSRR